MRVNMYHLIHTMTALLRCKPPEGAALHEPIYGRLQLLHMLSQCTSKYLGAERLSSTADSETASAPGSCAHDEPSGLTWRRGGTSGGKTTLFEELDPDGNELEEPLKQRLMVSTEKTFWTSLVLLIL